MKGKVKTWPWLLIGIITVSLFFLYLLREAFQNPDTVSISLADICAERKSCSECLTKKNADGSVSSCGWCPDAGKCVPRAGIYPVVPRAKVVPGERIPGSERFYTNTSIGEPLFACPVNTFVADVAKCADFQCSALTNCRECAGNTKCGWCPDSKKCVGKKDDKPDAPAGTTCAESSFLKESKNCPPQDCNTITDCAECAATAGCGFCLTNKKCVKLDNMGRPPQDSKGNPAEGSCKVTDMTVSPFQCPSILGTTQRPGFNPAAQPRGASPSTSDMPGRASLTATQDNTFAGQVGTFGPYRGGQPNPQETVDRGVMGIQTNKPISDTSGGGGVPSTGPQPAPTITAPGISRPLGSASQQISYPSAAGLGGTPFDDYIKIMVRSELAQQGVPLNEPFQVNDVLQNTTGYFKAKAQSLAK